MPAASAASRAGPIAALSCARMISASTPCVIKLSTSANCFAADVWASADRYFAPAASNAPRMAASSVFQRSSRKLDQLTPTVISAANATVDVHAAINAAARIIAFFIKFPPSFHMI